MKLTVKKMKQVRALKSVMRVNIYSKEIFLES